MLFTKYKLVSPHWNTGAIVCAAIYLSVSLLGYDANPAIFIFIFSLFVYVLYEFKNPAHFFWVIGFFTFISAPVIIVGPLLDNIGYLLLITLCLGSLLFLKMTGQKEIIDQRPIRKKSNSIYKYLLSCTIGVLIIIVSAGGVIHYIAPILLIYLLYLTKRNKILASLAMLSGYIVFLSVFVIFYWGGHGRVAIAVFGLGAFWIFWSCHNLPFGKIIALVATIFGPQLIGFIRGGKSIGEQFITGDIDSNLSPFLLANDISFREQEVNIMGLLEQLFLFFFMWIPRVFWEEKPYGFGFEYTVQNLDQHLIDAGHSIASLYVGEHIYYMGGIGLLSSLASVMLLAATYSYLCKQKYGFSYAAFITAIHIPTFIWGGLASYSARIWVGLLTFMLLYFIIELLKKHRHLRKPCKTSPTSMADVSSLRQTASP